MNVAIVRYDDPDNPGNCWRAFRVGSLAWKRFCRDVLPDLPEDVDMITAPLEDEGEA